MAEEILNSIYEVEYAGRKYWLRPVKAWVLQPPGKPGVVVALFKLPDGKTVRKVVMRLPP
ncbi:MAG: chromatin protein Cren7 [Pyrobaculum sp.]